MLFFVIQQDENIEFTDENSVRNMEFTDLNEDCVHLVFERLELADLINTAQINPTFANIASGIFRRNFSNFEFIIEKTKPEQDEKAFNVKSIQNIVKIRDFDVFSNIMKYFGSQIRNIAIMPRLNSSFDSE